MKRTILTGLVVIISTGAFSQGFNCNHAKLPAEVAICNNDELSALDRRLNALYFQVREEAVGDARLALEAEQQAWLRERNECGADEGCLPRAYDVRIVNLSSEGEPD